MALANRLRVLAIAAAALATTAFQADAATGGKRVALVIGNSTYTEAPLKNPANDARAMAASLRARGFEVIIKENASKKDMETAVADFGEKLTEGSTGLFFFAGHGMQVNGRNFLIPVDARITSEQRVRLETIDVDVVLDQMQAARAKVSLVILDACRNNPFERRFRSVGGGLAQINAPEGTMISYATAPGKVAADGEGSNGLYTQELLRALSQPGLKVEDVFKQVRINVSRLSNGAQTPWEASSLTGDFYFTAPQAAPAPAAPAQVASAPAAAPVPAANMELAFWDAVKGSNSPAELQAYLDQFPNGTFAPLARARVAALSRPTTTAAAPAAAPVVRSEPAPRPQQQAALPPAAAPVDGIDGKYTSAVRLPNGVFTFSIELDRGRITGFGTSPFANICKVAGSADRSGAIQQLHAECPGRGTISFTFAGKFTTGADGRPVAETKARGSNISGEIDAVWTRTQ